MYQHPGLGCTGPLPLLTTEVTLPRCALCFSGGSTWGHSQYGMNILEEYAGSSYPWNRLAVFEVG